MYRRVEEPRVEPPAELTVFDGRGFATAAEWNAAYDEFCDACHAWEAEHPGVELPEQVLGECPFDDELPHAGLWSRQVGEDGEDVMRCAEHDLPPDQH